MGASVVIGIMNFCLMFKFCQRYDENLDTYVGGFSVCDAISCLLTCGVIYRKKETVEGSGNELDFRKRFEKSMDKARGEGAFAEKKKRERKSKSVANYLSQNAKEKNLYVEGINGEDDPFSVQDGRQRRSKCHEFCCIVFCCMDASVYYGEEKYQKMVMKTNESERMQLPEEAAH